MTRTLLNLLICAAFVFAPAGLARDTVSASAYGMLLEDLLEAFYAEIVPCDDGANGVAEVCFLSDTASASYLAERLGEVAESYDYAGLRSGGWRAANGVWTVRLSFPNDLYGQLEVFLAETQDARVKGLVRLVKP